MKDGNLGITNSGIKQHIGHAFVLLQNFLPNSFKKLNAKFGNKGLSKFI